MTEQIQAFKQNPLYAGNPDFANPCEKCGVTKDKHFPFKGYILCPESDKEFMGKGRTEEKPKRKGANPLIAMDMLEKFLENNPGLIAHTALPAFTNPKDPQSSLTVVQSVQASLVCLLHPGMAGDDMVDNADIIANCIGILENVNNFLEGLKK